MEPQREESHRLVDELPPAKVAAALEALKAQDEPRSSGSWPPAWFGSVSGSEPDVSERVDEILRDGLGRRPA